MTQYLVTKFKDSTGRKHTHITKAKSNQRFTVVEAESKEEAKEKYEEQVKRFTVVEAESKEEAKEKYEEQVKRDAVIKVGQLFENIRECGK
ncbi:TPA: DUF1381 domain-containing protein [Staphylococcus aureus]|nr:DUF1381 domain-containing protein [Staphylococcus aureus]HDE5662807.1 DUF1381 domain-containing protein [Staphylococcus aureus]HDE6115722.1 DUF1381 domain-containing protein [Staphylococcus aureus]HDE6582790.1 DUF1381 domain-containing protein [Staphylococcus aureus]HDE8931437.1 DUF1381 domain-containing protein [Staphylococcus aureus]